MGLHPSPQPKRVDFHPCLRRSTRGSLWTYLEVHEACRAVSWPDDGGAWTCTELSRGHFVGAGGAVSWTPSSLAWPVRGSAWRLRGQVWACCGHTWTCSGPPPQCAWPYLEARGRIVDAYCGPTPDHVDVRRGRASSRVARLRCVDVLLDTRSYFLSSKRQKERSHRDLKKGEKDFLRIICRHKKVALPLCQISVRCRCKGFNAKFMKGFHTATYTQCVFCEQVVARSVWSAERFT